MSTSDQDVFSGGNPAAPAAPTPEQVTPQPTNLFTDQLAVIKNEDGNQKYDNVEKALEALNHSQGYIAELKAATLAQETELKNLREEKGQMMSAQEVMDQIAAANKPAEQVTPAAAGLDEDAVNKLVQDVLTKREVQGQSDNNFAKVNTQLSSQYGDKAAQVVEEKAKELGTTAAKIGELAKENPDLVLSLFQEKGQVNNSPTSSSINIPNAPVSNEAEIVLPEGGILVGVSSKVQTDVMKQIKDRVHKRLGVTNA